MTHFYSDFRERSDTEPMKNNAWLCLMGLVAVSGASANEVGRWYVTPQGGGLITDDDRYIEDGDGLFGLSVGRHLSEHWSLELNANGAQLDTFDPYAGSLDLLRVFRRNESLSPYLTFGAGAVRNDVAAGSDSTDFISQAGIGLLWKLGENSRGTSSFSLRPEIKARWDDVGRSGHFTDYIATLGFQLAFGGAAASPGPSSSDSAACTDIRTHSGSRTGRGCTGGLVTAMACSIPPIAAPGPRAAWRWMRRAARSRARSRWWALDSRPTPPRSLRRHARCSTRSAANLKKYPELQIELQGHTDSVGADQYNQRLSQQRADSVRAYLLTQGVSTSQVVAHGYGEARPIASNGTPEGRAQNRRVVMKVESNPGSVQVKGDTER